MRRGIYNITIFGEGLITNQRGNGRPPKLKGRTS